MSAVKNQMVKYIVQYECDRDLVEKHFEYSISLGRVLETIAKHRFENPIFVPKDKLLTKT